LTYVTIITLYKAMQPLCRSNGVLKKVYACSLSDYKPNCSGLQEFSRICSIVTVAISA
jgi:hypothetical protein